MIHSQHRTLIEDSDTTRKEGFIVECYFKNEKIADRNSSQDYEQHECNLVENSSHEGMKDASDSFILFLIECAYGSKGYLNGTYRAYADTDTH